MQDNSLPSLFNFRIYIRNRKLSFEIRHNEKSILFKINVITNK